MIQLIGHLFCVCDLGSVASTTATELGDTQPYSQLSGGEGGRFRNSQLSTLHREFGARLESMRSYLK